MRSLFPARLAVGWATMFVIGTDLFVVSPLLPSIAADYRVATAPAGLCVSAFALAYMLGAPLFGQAADRIGRHPLLLRSLIAFGLANLLTAAAPGLASLILARGVAGLAAAGVSPCVYALVGSAAPPARRASWMALAVSGLLLSLALGAPIGALAAASIGWAPVFVTLGVLSLLLVWPTHRVWRRFDEPPAAGCVPVPAAILAPRLIPMILWSTALYGMYTYLGTGLAAAGFDAARVARAILLYGCGATAGVLIGGRVADRLGIKLTATAGLAGLYAGLLLLRPAAHAGIPIELGLLATSLMAQLFFPAQQAGLVSDFPDQRATVLAWNNSALFFGIMLGSLLGGQAVALAGFGADLSLCAGLALAGCIGSVIVLPGAARLAGGRTA